MAKDGGDGQAGGNKGQSDKPETEEGTAAWEAIPEALRDAGRRATDLAQNPYARSLLAAGLVTAAAALAANKNVRETTRRNLKEATDAAEVAAENASKVGAAIINAATEAVQRMMALAGSAGTASGADEKPAPETATAQPATKRTAKPAAANDAAGKPSARKPKAASGTGGAKAAKPKAARKPAGSGAASKSSGKTSGGSTGGGAGRKRTPNQDN